MRRPFTLALTLLASAALVGAALVVAMQVMAAQSAERAGQPADGRQEFLAAMQRVRTRAQEPPDSPVLKEYPIYDYLLAARLRRDLDAAPGESLDTAIDQFVRAHAGQPVARGLQNAWLASLAERLRWDWFLARSVEATDPALLCDRLAGRLATGDSAGLAADALARWSLAQPPPRECAEVFAWLRAQGLLTPALRDNRARIALAQDKPALARDFLADVPTDRAPPLRQWLELLEDPRTSLSRLAANPSLPVEPEAPPWFTELAVSPIKT